MPILIMSTFWRTKAHRSWIERTLNVHDWVDFHWLLRLSAPSPPSYNHSCEVHRFIFLCNQTTGPWLVKVPPPLPSIRLIYWRCMTNFKLSWICEMGFLADGLIKQYQLPTTSCIVHHCQWKQTMFSLSSNLSSSPHTMLFAHWINYTI